MLRTLIVTRTVTVSRTATRTAARTARSSRTPARRSGVPRGTALAGIVAAATVTAGCGSTALPCVQYQPQMMTRTVIMRGYGAIQVTEEALVCTHRANSMADGLIGP